MEEYKRTFEDEVDWKIIDQLHNATNRFSSSSLEFKKMYFVILGISIPIIFKLNNEKFDISLLLSPLLISIFFWFLDSFTYYYQEKLRETMDKRFEKLKERNNNISANNNDSENYTNIETNNLAESEIENVTYVRDEYTLEDSRESNNRICRSIFNSSSAFYPILIVLNILLIILHYAGAF